MPTLIDTGSFIEDSWVRLGENQSFENQPRVILSLERLCQELRLFLSAKVDIGVELEASQDVEDIMFCLSSLKMVVLQFAAFADGRAFSQARLLRDRYDFTGDIRAIGDVIPDQLDFMRRCGFNQFELDDDVDYQLAIQAFHRMPYGYQKDLCDAVHR